MSDSDLVVWAKDNNQLQQSQTKLTEWMQYRLSETQEILAEATENLEAATKNKWKTSGWKSQVKRTKKKVEYYEKMLAALAANFIIVPDIPIDVFAVRTKRKYPLKRYAKSTNTRTDFIDRNVASEAPMLGSGEYVDPEPFESKMVVGRNDKDQEIYKRWASQFDESDFPLKAVKPVIIQETSRALALKIFDEIGTNPGRPGWSAGSTSARGADPMVIGRILYKRSGWSGDKSVSFLIAWWLKTSDIEV